MISAQTRCVCREGKPLRTFPDHALANSPRQAQHEHQDFGDRLVKFGRDFVAEFDIGQRAGQHLVFLDRDVMGLGDLDDLGADRALALGDDARRAGPVVMQRDGELVFQLRAHSARSRKCPALAGAGCGGAPSRITISPGSSSALISAWLSSPALDRNCAAVAGRSAHIRTEVRSPESEISAWTGPAGSTSSENRARQTCFLAATSPPPSRAISNCAIAVPCGVANGISKLQRGVRASMREGEASVRSGKEATCNSVWRAIAASVSSSSRCATVASGASDAIDGDATGCADGSPPRNGGGGVLARTVAASLRPSCETTIAAEARPAARLMSGIASCSRFSAIAEAT